MPRTARASRSVSDLTHPVSQIAQFQALTADLTRPVSQIARFQTLIADLT